AEDESHISSGSNSESETDDDNAARKSSVSTAAAACVLQTVQDEEDHVLKNDSVCDNECCEPGCNNPYFPTSSTRILKKLRRNRHFQKHWSHNHLWITYCLSRNKVFCFTCCSAASKKLVLSHTSGKSFSAFVVHGFDNWKKAKERFRHHEVSQLHKEAVMKLSAAAQPSIDTQLSMQLSFDQSQRRFLLQKLLSSIQLLAKQSLAFRGHVDGESNLVQLLKCRADDIQGLNQFVESGKYLFHDIINEIIEMMAHSILRTNFKAIQDRISPESPNLKPRCPTRWTVRTSAIDSVIKNYAAIFEEVEEIGNSRCESSSKAVGIIALMDRFSSYFGLKLALLVFSATEQVSVTLQHHDINAQEALAAVKTAVCYLNRQKSDDAFNLFYDLVLQEAAEKGLQQPTLPRQRKIPRRIDDGSKNHTFSSPTEFFRSQYFEVSDVLKKNLQEDLISPHLLF
uniref:Uncharacterized protein n=1 Tax=Amphimedon queenslandica TaxID=400682 RepID=A0A1X7UPW5_AMPQE